MNPRRADVLAATLLFLSTVLVFSIGAPRLGFYADDAGWLSSLPSLSSAREVWGAMGTYVPGRNLHVLWQWMVYQLLGGPPVAHLTALHLIQTGFDALTVVVYYALLRRLAISPPSALVAAACFAFWPVHGETHFWLAALPQNILSTLFAFGFVLTNLSLQRPVSWLLYLLDLAAFTAAVLTYEQVLPPLLLLVALRWRMIPYRLPHLALAAFSVWLRISMSGGPLPRAEAAAVVWDNIRFTFRSTAGRVGYHALTPIYGNSTDSDRLVAFLTTLAVTGLALRLLRRSDRTSPAPALLLIALAAYVAAYSLIWLWFISPRHHYLSSAAVFLVVAWVLERFRHPLLVLAVAPGLFVGAAAGRGESRDWEAAYIAKRRLMTELEPSLQNKHAVVLSGFPWQLGRAPLIAPHDASITPKLLFGLVQSFHGYLGYAPAAGGRFVGTHPLDGTNNFFYSTEPDVLVVRFAGWQGDRLGFELNPSFPLPYEVLSSRCSPSSASFSTRRVHARRQTDDLLLNLDYATDVPAAAVVRFPHGNAWYPWGEVDPAYHRTAWPVLLANASLSCTQSILLRHFPRTDRIRVEFYAVPANHPASLLTHTEARVEP